MRRNILGWFSRLASGASAMVLLGLAGAGLAQAGTVSDTPDLLSSAAKTVTVDPKTGAVVAVSSGMIAAPDISNHNICNTGDGCYFSGQIPLANQGFFGSPGTFRGSWPSRSGFGTGMFVAAACWVQACSPAFGPNTRVTFSSLVTGTSFTIF